MIDTKTLVDDVLLRELSAETRKIGSRVLVKPTPEQAAYQAEIADVIIMPHAEFYRSKFMGYYMRYNFNSVKALKELAVNFPFTPDFQIGIAYVLNLEVQDSQTDGFNPVKIKSEIEVLNSSVRQESFTIVKKESEVK